MGYLPQFKYRCGKTFGKETNALSKVFKLLFGKILETKHMAVHFH